MGGLFSELGQAFKGQPPDPTVGIPASPSLPPVQSQQLPQSSSQPGGGPTYAATQDTSSGRVKTAQVLKSSGAGVSKDLDVNAVLAPKHYAVSPDDPSFVQAPSIQRSFGIDQSPQGWGGWGGKGAQIGIGFLSGIAPIIAGALTGGRKGAFEMMAKGDQQRAEQKQLAQKQTYDVSQDKTMREAYEIARGNYEEDYNNGKTGKQFGDYLAEAMETMNQKYSGTLGTLIENYGKEDAIQKYIEMHPGRGGRGGGGGAGGSKVHGYDDNGVWHSGTAAQLEKEGVRLHGQTTYGSTPKGVTYKSYAPPPLGSYLKK